MLPPKPWSADFLRDSPWLTHLPALFWLVDKARPQVAVTLGLGDGMAHFVLCQAMSARVLQPRCLGLASPGPGGRIPDDLLAWNAAHHAAISRLALKGAEDPPDPVDLLLINGDAGASFSTWTNRLSDRGILVLHGAARGLETGSRPRMDLPHGPGLAIVLWGASCPPEMREVFASAAARNEVADLLGRLGEAQHREGPHQSAAACDALSRLAHRDRLLAERHAASEALAAKLAVEREARAARERDCTLLTRALLERERSGCTVEQALATVLAASRRTVADGSVSESESLLRDMAEAQQKELAALQTLASGRKARLRDMAHDMAKKEAARERQIAQLAGDLQMARQAQEQMRASLSWRITAPLRALAGRLRGGSRP